MKHLPFLILILIASALLFNLSAVKITSGATAPPPTPPSICQISRIYKVGTNWILEGETEANLRYTIELRDSPKSFEGSATDAGLIKRDLGSGYARNITVTLTCWKGSEKATATGTLPASGETENPKSQCINSCTADKCANQFGKSTQWACDLTKCKPGRGACVSIGAVGCPPGGLNTAIGKIPCDPKGLAGKIFSLALGVAGGIALLLIIAGGYRIIASQGDPEALASGKEIITSAIAGLLFIIFSAALLRILGCNILGLPCG